MDNPHWEEDFLLTCMTMTINVPIAEYTEDTMVPGISDPVRVPKAYVHPGGDQLTANRAIKAKINQVLGSTVYCQALRIGTLN